MAQTYTSITCSSLISIYASSSQHVNTYAYLSTTMDSYGKLMARVFIRFSVSSSYPASAYFTSGYISDVIINNVNYGMKTFALEPDYDPNIVCGFRTDWFELTSFSPKLSFTGTLSITSPYSTQTYSCNKTGIYCNIYKDYSVISSEGTSNALTIGKPNTINPNLPEGYKYTATLYIKNRSDKSTAFSTKLIDKGTGAVSFTPSFSDFYQFLKSDGTFDTDSYSKYITFYPYTQSNEYWYQTDSPYRYDTSTSTDSEVYPDISLAFNPENVSISLTSASGKQDEADVNNGENKFTIANGDGSASCQIIVSKGLESEETVTISAASGDYAWKPEIGIYAPLAPSGLSVVCDITFNILIDGTVLATKTTSAVLNISSGDVLPSCSIAASDDSGYQQKYGAYLLGNSVLHVVVSASYLYGATFSSVSVSANGKIFTELDISAGVITSADYKTISATVTDSRGCTCSATLTIAILDWHAPQLVSLALHRGYYSGGVWTANDSGNYAKIDWGINVSPVNNTNTKALTITAPDGSHSITPSDYDSTGTIYSAADTETSYDIVFVLTDSYTSVTRTLRLSTAGVVMDIKAGGKGVGFGKVAETDNVLDISSDWDVYVHGMTLKEYIQAVVAGTV